MKAVGFVNELYGDEDGKRRARVKARFINTAMMATLLGRRGLRHAGRWQGRERRRRSVQLRRAGFRAARRPLHHRAAGNPDGAGRTSSNIVWEYPETTIPRHLRDIVVTEYGIADLRGKGDRDTIAAMLSRRRALPG